MRFFTLAALLAAAEGQLICHKADGAPDKVDDKWCDDNCNHVPSNCPATCCECVPSPPPGPPPTPGPPPPPPAPTPPGPFGQQMLGYYSSVGVETIADSGINAISIAFFNPSALAQGPCDFSSPTGEAPCLNYKRYLIDVQNQRGNLSANTSPKRGEKPVVLISFGGMNMGGGAWMDVFGSDEKAAQFGTNAAALAAALASQVDVIAGIDLDVEGASALPSMGAFMKAFRADAPFDTVPLMLCAFSGLAFPDNGEHFKIAIMKEFGPAQQGFTWLNMMVDNQYQSCEGMAHYWLNDGLDFLPASARLFGMWGVNIKEWMLKNPGCDDGGSNLFPYMQRQGVGFAMWEMWIGDVSPIKAIADSIRADEPNVSIALLV